MLFDATGNSQCNITETGMLSVLMVLGSIVAWMMTAVRSSETHRAQLDLERAQAARRESELRRESEVREARHMAEAHELRRALTDAAVREERLRGELRAAAREMELRSMLRTTDQVALAPQPPATSSSVQPPVITPAPQMRAASLAPPAESAVSGESAVVLAAQPAQAEALLVEANGAARAGGPHFAAFVSHAKADAAMEARYLQTELETALEAPVFLDSDNLRDLRDMPDHVRDSGAVVLLQSRHVLERPFCVIELLTAIDEGVPIVGLAMCQCGATGYQFEAAANFLKHFDTLIQDANPYAVDALREFGIVDLAEVAWKLSSTIPKVLSMPFNPSASRMMLAAMRHDACESIRHARAIKLPKWDDVREQWLQERAAEYTTSTVAPAPLSNGKAASAAAAAAAAAAASEGEEGEEVAPVGVALLQAAKVCRALVPLGYLAQAVAQAARAVVKQQRQRQQQPEQPSPRTGAAAALECERLVVCVGALEQALLRAEEPSKQSGPLGILGSLLQQALVCIVGLQSSEGAGPGTGTAADAVSPTDDADADASAVAELARLRASLGTTACQLKGVGIEAWPFDDKSTTALHLAADARWVALRQQLAAARKEEAVSTSHRELLATRAALVSEQAAQVAEATKITSALSPLDFLRAFPVPAGEAERLAAVDASMLMHAPIPLREAEMVATVASASGKLGKHLRYVHLSITDRNYTRVIATHCRDDADVWHDTAASFGGDARAMPLAPRKTSTCQYVIDAQEVICLRGGSDPAALLQQTFSLDKGFGLDNLVALIASSSGEEAAAEVAAMGEAYNLKESVPEGGPAAGADADANDDGDADADADADGDANGDAHGEAGEAAPTPLQELVGKLFSDLEAISYIGVPLLYRGQTVGTLCATFLGEEFTEELMATRRGVLVYAAQKFSEQIDAIAARVRQQQGQGQGQEEEKEATVEAAAAAKAPAPPAQVNGGGAPMDSLDGDAVASSLHELSGTTLSGRPLPMASLAGRVVVLANVASRCGLAPPVFTQLAAWHAEFGSRLEIVLYPSNEFGKQELALDEVAAFVAGKGLPSDGGGCTVMNPVELNGAATDPVWRFAKRVYPGDVWWNFAGVFLIDQRGAVVGRYRAPSQLDALGEKLRALVVTPPSGGLGAKPGSLSKRASRESGRLSPEQ